MVRSLIDRVLVALALLVLRMFFRSVEVAGADRIPRDRPMLVVANHFNGMVDAVLLVRVLGRIPRFLAKSTLWNTRLARPLFALVGMVPVHRPEDRPPETSNVSAFEAAHRLLAKSGIVAIFPEGATHDTPALARIRTGAARIALGAYAQGVEDVVVVPIGLTFDDKLALRSRVFARVGDPIDLADELEDYVHPGEAVSEENTDAVRRLTAEIEARLRQVSPDYRDLREAAALSRAAEITRRTGLTRHHDQVPLADMEPLAQKLAYAPPDARAAILATLARYQLDLDLVGLRDHQVVPGYTARQLLIGFVKIALLVTALAPLWIPGLLVNVIPYHIVKAVGRAVPDPVMKGTMRILSALVAFPLTWVGVVLASGVEGWLQSLALVAFLPISGLVAVSVFERIVRGYRAWRGWQAMRDRRALLGEILADRRKLVAAVEDAAAQVPEDADRRPAA